MNEKDLIVIEMAKEICTTGFVCETCAMSKFNPNRTFIPMCRFVDDSEKLYNAGYRKISKYDMKLIDESNNANNLMDNMEKLCLDFVVDVLCNKPKDMEGKIIKYSENDRVILMKQIEKQIEILEEQRLNLSSHCYRRLANIYEGVYLLLKGKKF